MQQKAVGAMNSRRQAVAPAVPGGPASLNADMGGPDTPKLENLISDLALTHAIPDPTQPGSRLDIKSRDISLQLPYSPKAFIDRLNQFVGADQTFGIQVSFR